jgi:hypothetical protein
MPLVACEDVRTPFRALRVVFEIGHLQILCRGAGRLDGQYQQQSAVYPVRYDVLKDFEAVSLLINGRLVQQSQHGRRAAGGEAFALVVLL